MTFRIKRQDFDKITFEPFKFLYVHIIYEMNTTDHLMSDFETKISYRYEYDISLLR